MKKILVLVVTALLILSCNDKPGIEKFKLTGEIKNTSDQKIYLEQLYFSQQNSDVIDSAEIKNGKFQLSGNAAEEGLYRIRLEKQERGFLFINDKAQIKFTADAKNTSLQDPVFNTPANVQLKKLLTDLNAMNESITGSMTNIERLKTSRGNDSLIAMETDKLTELDKGFRSFITKFIDTISDPVVAMFALSYTQNMDPSELKDVIPNLSKRFPKHQGVASLVLQYNQFLAQQSQQKQVNTKALEVGTIAPDFTMNDTNGKPFSLSSLKGKYVLVDFWASWCGPCRAENPFVVAAFNKYKDKNFSILGVSLDEDKAQWINAIKEDRLSWQQVSDLKGMSSEAVSLYGFEAIPYNVLLDPQGKIIATALRGNALDKKLNEVLQ